MMFKLKFRANIAHASTNAGEHYRVALSNDNNYKDYVLFQKSRKSTPGYKADCVYIECNGKISHDACSKAVLTKESLNFIIENTPVLIDIKEAKIDQEFVEYLKEILGDILQVNE